MKKILIGLLSLTSISSYAQVRISPISFIVTCIVKNASQDNVINSDFHANTVGRTKSLDSRGITTGDTITLDNGEKRSFYMEDLSDSRSQPSFKTPISDSGLPQFRVRICDGVSYCGMTSPVRVYKNDLDKALVLKTVEVQTLKDASFEIADPTSNLEISCKGLEVNQYQDLFKH